MKNEANYNELGKYVQQVRKEVKWTQEELGRKIGLGKSSISKIESGKTKLSVEDARILLEIMGRKLEMGIHDLDYDMTKEYSRVISFGNVCVRWYAEQNQLTLEKAYEKMMNYKALNFLSENYAYDSSLPKEIILEDIKTVIQRNLEKVI